jgi:hypothetical protein
VIPYESHGWKYKQVAHGDQAGFEVPSFDDSGWATGQAGFGTTDQRCAWNNEASVHTPWSPDTDVLIRKHFAVPAGTTSIHIAGTVDNDAQLWINGTPLNPVAGDFCEGDNINFDVPASALGSDNVLAIRGIDRGAATYLDVEVTATSPAQTLATVDAGTFIKFLYTDSTETTWATYCTTGFGVQQGGTRYVLGAKHCVEESMKANRPAMVTTVDDAPGERDNNRPGNYVLAAKLDCLFDTIACLLPQEVVAGRSNDFFAWRPDSSVVTNKVRTGQGILPVLGVKKLDSNRGGEVVCHYGVGSSKHLGSAEKCGKNLAKPLRERACRDMQPDCLPGMVVVPMAGTGGDSGGPVYIYNKKKTGVYAVGLNLAAGEWCPSNKQDLVCKDSSLVLPIDTITSRLGVSLLVEP